MRFHQLPVQAVDSAPSHPRCRHGLWEAGRWPGSASADAPWLSSLHGVGSIFTAFSSVESVRYGGRIATRYDPDAGLFLAVDAVMALLDLRGE